MAITVANVTNALKPIIQNSPMDGTTQVIVLSDSSFVDVNTFATIFANAADMTANSLHAIDNGTLGYSAYIDEWKQGGYIS